MTEQVKKTFCEQVKNSLEQIKGDKKCCKSAKLMAQEFVQNSTPIDYSGFVCDECKCAFLRQVFVLNASVNSPEKSNHLEFKFLNQMDCDEFCVFMRECGFEPKFTQRSGKYVVYFKDGETIFQLLSFIGAQKIAFDFLNTIIEKQVRNNCNRVTNCEYANMKKSADATKRHSEAIDKLFESGKIDALPENLRYTANLKKENPDLSLSDLAQIHVPPVTKSCVNHRLEKIIKIALGQ